MGLSVDDVSRFSPALQKQVMQKLKAAQTIEGKNKPSKYHAVKDNRGEVKFDSKAEARRFDALMLLLKAGAISDLKLQPQFTLQEAYTTPDGVRVRAIRYVADYSYKINGDLIVEDVKSKATKTRVYAIKKKLLHEKYGITVKEVED